MDMRNRVRLTASECLSPVPTCPFFPGVFYPAQSHYQWVPGWRVPGSHCPSFSVGSGLQEQTNGGMQMCVYKWSASAWSQESPISPVLDNRRGSSHRPGRSPVFLVTEVPWDSSSWRRRLLSCSTRRALGDKPCPGLAVATSLRECLVLTRSHRVELCPPLWHLLVFVHTPSRTVHLQSIFSFQNWDSSSSSTSLGLLSGL